MVQANRHTTHKNAVSKDEQGVSAVIGVILMVAVTVILAAVIGAFVFNMYPNLLPNQSNQPFGFSVWDDGRITITNNGGVDADAISVTVNDFATQAEYTSDASSNPWSKLDTVGGMVTIGDGTADFYAGMKVTVTGSINGNRIVLATYTTADDYAYTYEAPTG